MDCCAPATRNCGDVFTGSVTNAEGGKRCDVNGGNQPSAWLESLLEPLAGIKADRVDAPPGDVELEVSGVVRTFFILILYAIDAVEIVAIEPIKMKTIVNAVAGWTPEATDTVI
jgi:hypothetical protein